MSRAFFDAAIRGDVESIKRANNFRLSYIDRRKTSYESGVINGFSVFHYSIYYRRERLFDMLLNDKFAFLELRLKNKVFVSQGDQVFYIQKGAGPLSVAVLSNVEIAQKLLDVCYTRLLAPHLSDDKQNCYHIAAQVNGPVSNLYALNEYLCYNLVDMQDSNRANCLMLAAKSGNGDFLRLIAQQCENEIVLARVLRAVAYRDNNGRDVFDFSRYYPNNTVVDALNKLRRYYSLLSEEITVENSDDIEIKMRMRRSSVKDVILEESFQMEDMLVF